MSRKAETTFATPETRHSASDEPCPAHLSWPLASAITSGRSRRSKHLGGAQSREQIVDQHERYLDTAASGTGRMFKIVLSPATDAIGNIGYWDKTWREEIVYETGWMILPEYQGRGYASTALALLVERLRREHVHRFLHAFPAVTNGPSNALCRRAGFTNRGECEFEVSSWASFAMQ